VNHRFEERTTGIIAVVVVIKELRPRVRIN